MRTCAASLPDSRLKTRLFNVLTRNKPFRHFRDIVHTDLAVRDQWSAFHDDALARHAARFGLRRRLTWLCMTLSFGATMALAVWFDLSGLPALPLLSLGFLAPNADLLWRRIQLSRGAKL